MCHLVVCPPQLEAEHWLQVFSFEQHIAFEAIAQISGVSQRCLRYDFVNFGGEDETKILHGESEKHRTILPAGFYVWGAIWEKKVVRNWRIWNLSRSNGRGWVGGVFRQ
jgi:hypothetical protein